jgi:hypothetical protein
MTPVWRKKREHALQDCLDQVHAGGNLDAALDKHPQYSADMRSDLEAARWLHEHQQDLAPRPGFVPASRRRLLDRIAADGSVTPANRLRWSFASLRFPSTRRKYIPRLALAYLLLVSLLFCAGRVSRASLTWMPGDLGYPLKTAMEELAVLVTPTSAGDARLHIQFAHRRMLEAQALVLEGRYEYIPATVADFSRHVDRTVGSVHRLARQDRAQAYRLALDLERVLNQQTSMVVLLAGFTPENARSDFERVLTISEGGVSELRKFVEEEESGAGRIDDAVTISAPNWAMDLAYSIVRGRLAG